MTDLAAMTTLEFHPLADIFPLVEGTQFDELVSDVKVFGLREPILIFEGKVLDGRNRYRACLEAGVEPTLAATRAMTPSPSSFRSISVAGISVELQRAMVAAKLATLKLGDNQHSGGLPIGRASALLAVGERTVARAREVQEHGAPELVRAVEAGRVSVSAAADLASQPIDEQRDIVVRGEREILQAAIQIRAQEGRRSALWAQRGIGQAQSVK